MRINTHVSPSAPGGLLVRASADTGYWRRAFDLPAHEQFIAPLVVDPDWLEAGAFGVVVRGRGAEKIYRDGSILLVMPLDQWSGLLVPGRRVILQRIRRNVEVTVCEIEVSNGRAWLSDRSDDPADPAGVSPVEMPWPSAFHMWKRGGDRFLIAGVVLLALISEE